MRPHCRTSPSSSNPVLKQPVHVSLHHPVHPTQSCNNSFITQFIQPSPETTSACQFTSPSSSNSVLQQLIHVSLHNPVHPTQSCKNSFMSVYITLFIQPSPETTDSCQLTSPCSSNSVLQQLMHVSLHHPVHPTQSCNN